MNYLAKHWLLLKEYSKIGFKFAIEYKAQFFSNLLGHLVLIGLWFFFWKLMFGNVSTMGQWTYPMMLLLIGFFQLGEAMWQFGYMTLRVSDRIMDGDLDKYLSRPINPLFGILAEDLDLIPILPITTAIIIILTVIINYFSLDLIKLVIALSLCAIGTLIVHLVTIALGLLGFWLGRTRTLMTIYRSLNIAKTYPGDILGAMMRGILTYGFPAMILTTNPVLTVTNWTIQQSLLYLTLAIGLWVFWIIIVMLLWKYGIKKYESSGG